MDVFLIILGSICLLLGIVGCVVPVIPGVPLAYVGLLCAHWTDRAQLSWQELVIWGVITVVVQLLDYIVPAWGTKKLGGSKWGVWGSVLGLLIGLFFGLPGIIIGPFVGAVLFELIYFNFDNSITLEEEFVTKNRVQNSTGKQKNIDMPHHQKFKTALISGLGSFLGLLVGTILKLICCGGMIIYFIKELI